MRRSRQLGTGFTFTEGPIWHPVEHYLLFSDMPADVRRRWDARGGVREVRRPSNKHNGMTYDADLNLIVCEHATSSLVRERGGQREVLASHFEGASSTRRTTSACAPTARSISPTPGTAACRSTASSARASSASRASIACRRAAGSRSCWSTARASSSRTGSASRRTRRLLYVNDTVNCMIWAFDVSAGRLALARPHLRERHPLGARAGRARRHEVRRAGQHLGHGAGRRLGLFAERQPARQGARARAGRESDLGRRGLPHAVHDRDAFALRGEDQGRPAHSSPICAAAAPARAARRARRRSRRMAHCGSIPSAAR